jgi:excisionase family DNA binding protein
VPSQVLPTINNRSEASVHRAHPVTTGTKPFVTRLLPAGRGGLRVYGGGGEYLLTVAEVAERLGVCTATIYKLCDRHELAHVRILNTIRIVPAQLAAYLARAAGRSPTG